jgi:hypothetical protein
MPLASRYKDGTTAEKDEARGMVGNGDVRGTGGSASVAWLDLHCRDRCNRNHRCKCLEHQLRF